MEHIERVWPEWKVVELIGRGGFGSVYKAERTAGGYTTTSAIKVINIPSSETEVDDLRSMGMDALSVRSYFEDTAKGVIQEVATMDRLKGAPHVVHVEDYYLEENGDGIGWTILIRMELLESLRNYQLRVGSPDQRETAKIGRDICDALRCCHEVGIIHRDVKPGNIFLSAYGDYKLGDFGVARRLGESTRSGLSMAGTGPYMAPEIPSGSYDKTVDTYSLGIMLYQYLNGGRLPFLPVEGTVTQSDMQKAQTRRLMGERPPLPAGEGIDPDLAAIVRKACEPNPADRWQSAAEMGNALKRWLDGNYTAEAATETASSWIPAQAPVASVPVGTQTVNLGDFFSTPHDSSASATDASASAEDGFVSAENRSASAADDIQTSIAGMPVGTQTFRIGDYLGPRREVPAPMTEEVQAPLRIEDNHVDEPQPAVSAVQEVAPEPAGIDAVKTEAEKSRKRLDPFVWGGISLGITFVNSCIVRAALDPYNENQFFLLSAFFVLPFLLFGVPMILRLFKGDKAERISAGICTLLPIALFVVGISMDPEGFKYSLTHEPHFVLWVLMIALGVGGVLDLIIMGIRKLMKKNA